MTVRARPRLIATILLLLAGLTAAAANYPGSLSYDSLTQLVEGRTASYGNWHPPFMSWMLGVADGIAPGTGLFMLFDMALGFGSLLAILWLRPKAGWACVAAAAVIACLPQMFLYQATVWKDVLFADAALAGFVALAFAAAKWNAPRLRLAMLAMSAVFLALAALARQNGAVIVPCAAAALAWIAFVLEKDRRRAAGYAGGLLLLVTALVMGANAALAPRIDPDAAGTAGQFKLLELYDLTGLVKADPALPLPVLEAQSPALAAHIKSDGVRLFTPVRNDTLAADQPLQDALDDTDNAVVAAQWRQIVADHPLRYLALRARLFAWVFATPDLEQCHAFHVGAEGDPGDMKTLGLRPRYDARDRMLQKAADLFVGTPFFSHVFYALLAMGALVLLLRRRAPADIALAGLLCAALLFTATFFVISIACDYRYLYVLDLSALAAALYLAADPPFTLSVRAAARQWPGSRPRR